MSRSDGVVATQQQASQKHNTGLSVLDIKTKGKIKGETMKIGNFETENNVFLAPMAGVTDLPFRKICRRYGAGLVYSEMVSAKGLYYNDKKTADLMRIDDEERPCAIQIFGSDADIMAEVIPKVMTVKPDIIDINMGCPTPKIVNNGDGSALLKNS